MRVKKYRNKIHFEYEMILIILLLHFLILAKNFTTREFDS